MLHSLNNPLRKIEVFWSGVSIPIRHSEMNTPHQTTSNHLNFSKRGIEAVAYRDGYAKPNYINSLLYSGILMIVPTEYSAGLLMALWIRVVPVL